MDFNDIIMIAAVLAGPVLAVQAQKYLERSRDSENRKRVIFKNLMATRATRLSVDHVQALNMIDVEFTEPEFKKVVNAWRLYHDHLSDNNSNTGESAWVKRDELFIALLKVMGDSLGYDFDDVMLKRTAYSPIGHEDLEADQTEIRKGLVKVLTGKADFPVFFTNEFNSSDDSDQHKASNQVDYP